MNTQPLDHHIDLSRETVPALAWNAPADPAAHRARCTARLRELLGMDRLVPCDPVLTVLSEEMLGENLHIHFTVETEPGYAAHCDLLLPPDAAGKLPLCVCLQGHSKGSHISLGIIKYPGDEASIRGGDRDFAVRAVKEGFAALAIDQRAFGRNGGTENGPACQRPALTALMLGRTLIGERVWDVSRVLDAVLDRFGDRVTAEGSVLTGNSGGGTTVYYTACLEDRFAGYMPSCAVCGFHESIISLEHCICNYVPGILQWFDMGDMAAMIAPKNLVVVCGRDDPIFPLAGTRRAFARIREIYAAAGAEEKCALVVGEGGHRFYADDAWPVMRAMLEK